MSSDRSTHEFTFEQDQTCKERWVFEVSRGDEGLVIEDVAVTAHKTGDGGSMGCQGHPKTIAALLRGRSLDSIDPDSLADAACVRACSCGQALATCLRQLKEL